MIVLDEQYELMRESDTMAVSFKGAHFPPEVILMGIRWYLAFPLSTRHVEELLEERGVNVDHSTINRWVIKYSPQLTDILRCGFICCAFHGGRLHSRRLWWLRCCGDVAILL
jgi:hypothetical protein